MDRVRVFRSVAFGLALFFWLEQFRGLSGGVGFGAQFRYLTIWALTASVLSFGLALRRGPPPLTLAAVATVMNGLVVVLYWRLFFIDPALVNNGTPVWWREYYLHLLGPLLQAFDALVVMAAFRAPLRVAGWLAVLILAYVGWAELVVQPLNDWPAGRVTSGLPYPFLNDLEPAARLGFYARTAAMALVFVALGWGLCRWRLGRQSRASRRRAARPER